MSGKDKSKLFNAFRWGFIGLGIIFFIIGAANYMSKDKYKKIVAKDKNAYITNLDTKTTPPTVYISFDYDEDRSIIGRLPPEQYTESMQEGDWVSIFYNVDNPRTITQKNPYALADFFLGCGLLSLIVALILIFAFYRGKKKE